MDNRQKKKSALDRFIAWLLMLLQNNFIGRFFTSYERANDRFLKKVSGKQRVSKKRLARFIENNKVIGFVPKIFRFLMRVPLRDYGIMMFMTGAIVAALYPLYEMKILFIDVTFKMFVLGCATCACAIPLFFSSRSLADNVLSSRFFGFILFDFLGIDDEGFRQASEQGRISFAAFAFLIGASLGVAAYFIMPTYTVLLLLGIALVYCTFRTPEIGAIITILALPFAEIKYSCIMALFTFACYVIKVFLGKRVFKLEYFDLWVGITILLVTVFGVNYADPLSSLEGVVIKLVVMLSYFMFSNLICSKVWFRRSVVAFSTTSLVVAVVAVAQAILSKIAEGVDELATIVTPGAEITSVFGSSSVLAHFMVVAIPFALVHMISEKKDLTKFVGFILASFFVASLVLASSASGLLGVLIGALLVLAFYRKRAVYLIILVLIALPVLYFTLPESTMDTIFSIGPLKDVSISGEVAYFKEAFLKAIEMPFGVGVEGTTINAVFGQGYIDSLPVHLLASYGVLGALSFLVLLAMFVRVALSYSVRAKNKYRRVNGCAGLCSILALLSVSVFDNSWEDKKIFLLFVIIIALSLAYIKIDREEETVTAQAVDFSRATIDIALKDNAQGSVAPRRGFVRAPKVKKNSKRQEKIKAAEEKEFSNTEELFINRRKYDEEQED